MKALGLHCYQRAWGFGRPAGAGPAGGRGAVPPGGRGAADLTTVEKDAAPAGLHLIGKQTEPPGGHYRYGTENSHELFSKITRDCFLFLI